jgi:hypothetical protein
MRCVHPWQGDMEKVGSLGICAQPPHAVRRVRAGRRRSGARLGVLGGHAPQRRRAHGASHAAGRPPGALSLSGAAGRVTCGRPEHLMEHL